MSGLQPVRGTHDLLSEDQARHRMVVERARTVAGLYGFDEIATPVFEFTEVFARTLGDTSDIVTKEMYTFETKGGESVTLRPEGTAGVARAFISNGMAQNIPWKVFYNGPMFRHERPQKGRQRQFHQIGVELIGADSPQSDVEVIALASQTLAAMGIDSKITLELNSLGDAESRHAYRAALVDFFTLHEKDLSDDSRERLSKNPMRILDSKSEQDKAIVAEAPVFSDFLNEPSRDFFSEVKDGLSALHIGFVENPRLVRGLDYYCHTAFEFTTTALGAQGTVLAGGRYDGLIEQMGGPKTPGIGWAAGIERLALLDDSQVASQRPIAIIPVSGGETRQAQVICQTLRVAGIPCDIAFSGNLKRRLKRADKINARAAVLIGEDELRNNAVSVRDLDTGGQFETPIDGLAVALSDLV